MQEKNAIDVDFAVVMVADVLHHHSFYNIPEQPYLLLVLVLLLMVDEVMPIFLVELDDFDLEMMVEYAFVEGMKIPWESVEKEGIEF